MAHFKLLIVPALLASVSAFAGYGQLVPPVGWSEVLGKHYYKSAATEVFDAASGRILSKAEVNVGGRAVAMSTSLRLAPNAARVAGAFGFTPAGIAVIVAAGVGSALYDYYMSGGFQLENGAWVKTVGGEVCTSGCVEYGTRSWYQTPTADGDWRKTKLEACQVAMTALEQRNISVGQTSGNPMTLVNVDVCTFRNANGTYYSNWGYQTRSIPPYDTSTTSPVSQTEFEEKMATKPLTNGVPQQLPIPLPVEKPILNPSPDAEPVPQPLRVPQGEPQPVPNTNPQEWKTPVVDIVPAPTESDPWRVDVQPKDIVKTDPEPLPEAAVVPETTPEGQTETEKDPDLCEKNPDILACQKLDTPESGDLEKKDISATVTPDSGWGAGDAACPVARHIVVQGRDIPIPYDMFCTYMRGIRPVIIALAWLAAAFILIGARGGE